MHGASIRRLDSRVLVRRRRRPEQEAHPQNGGSHCDPVSVLRRVPRRELRRAAGAGQEKGGLRRGERGVAGRVCGAALAPLRRERRACFRSGGRVTAALRFIGGGGGWPSRLKTEKKGLPPTSPPLLETSPISPPPPPAPPKQKRRSRDQQDSNLRVFRQAMSRYAGCLRVCGSAPGSRDPGVRILVAPIRPLWHSRWLSQLQFLVTNNA